MLQRAPARAAVWGWAAPGALVTVELTKEPAEEGGVESDDASAIIANDADRIRPPRAVLATARTSAAAGTGEWIVHLPPQPASHGPFALRILARSGGDVAGSNITIESAIVADLAFGDVWLCAGQSNMQFTVAASFDAAAAIAESATFGDGIRIATVAMTAADVERDDATAATAGDAAYEKSAWAKATPQRVQPARHARSPRAVRRVERHGLVLRGVLVPRPGAVRAIVEGGSRRVDHRGVGRAGHRAVLVERGAGGRDVRGNETSGVGVGVGAGRRRLFETSSTAESRSPPTKTPFSPCSDRACCGTG